MSATASQQIQELTDLLGEPLAKFCLNCDEWPSDAVTPTQGQQQAIDAVLEVRKLLLDGSFPQDSIPVAIRVRLCEHQPGSLPFALQLRSIAGGTLPTIVENDGMEQAISILARDLYPAFLLPEDDLPFQFPIKRMSAAATGVLYRHPEKIELESAVLSDPVLAQVFSFSSEHTGRTVMAYRSTGVGGTLQLGMLADLCLSRAWFGIDSGGQPSLEEFVERAKSGWRFIGNALRHRTQDVQASQGFTGVLLPSEDAFVFDDDVTIRAAGPADTAEVPDALSGALTTTTPTGESLQIHYEGDVVAEFRQPYKVKTAKPDFTGVPAEFPKDVLSVNSVEDIVLRLRLSLLLAVQREGSRPQIVPTWRRIDDPLNAGEMVSWNDAHQATNLMPIKLTPDEMRAWQDCYTKLTAPILKNIHVAASRIVRATGERRDSADVLIDSVIAWENLFGSGEGETTMRVSTCLALLFEQDFESRKSRQKRLQDIYRMRSRVVHGSDTIGAADVAMCFEALDVAVHALRELIGSKNSLLEISNSSERSKYLLLHG